MSDKKLEDLVLSIATRLEKVERYYKGGTGPGSTSRVVERDPTGFAHRVRVLRTSLGLSQKAFSEKYGVDIETLQNWEQGRRSPSKVAETLLQLIAMNPDLVEQAAKAVDKARGDLIKA
jgi:DNA-binding transcriptional regulator YiaG